MQEDGQDWYWDLVTGKAVRADERGPGDQVLGPYPTRAAAEDWKQRVESRNEEWEADDEQWAGEDVDRDVDGSEGDSGSR